MWFIVIGIIVLGILAAIAGHLRNKKLQGMLEGEIKKFEAKEISEGCCGQHETRTKKDSLLAAVSKKIEYYEDEDLDRFIGTAADAYSENEVEEFP